MTTPHPGGSASKPSTSANSSSPVTVCPVPTQCVFTVCLLLIISTCAHAPDVQPPQRGHHPSLPTLLPLVSPPRAPVCFPHPTRVILGPVLSLSLPHPAPRPARVKAYTFQRPAGLTVPFLPLPRLALPTPSSPGFYMAQPGARKSAWSPTYLAKAQGLQSPSAGAQSARLRGSGSEAG